jgi:sugar phosphate isomerase/epimerase
VRSGTDRQERADERPGSGFRLEGTDAVVRMGYMTWGMPSVPAETSIPFIAALGFRAIELTVLPHYADALARLDAAARARIRLLLAEHGLQLPAIAAHFGLLAPAGAAAEAQMRDLTAAVHLAADLAPPGVALPCIDTTAGAGPHDWDRVRGRLVERLGTLCRHAAREGVTVAIEPHVHSCLDRVERVRWLLAAVAEPNLRLNLDISHFEVQGLDVADVCAILGPLAAHTHVKDERGRAPDFEFVIPGEGTFDCGAFLTAMGATGYRGAITAEISVMVQRRPGYDPFDAARRTYRWMADAFARAGLVPE